MEAWQKGAVIGGLLGFLFTLSLIYVVFGALIGAFLSMKKGLLLGLIWGVLSIPVVILSRFSYFAEATHQPPLILKILFMPGYISEYLGQSSDLNIVIYLGILPLVIGATISSLLNYILGKYKQRRATK